MKIRTYYWHERVVGRLGILRRMLIGRNTERLFRIGNSGDIFAEDIIKNIYGATPINTDKNLPRLLLIGSVADRITSKDIVCGVGAKHTSIKRPIDDVPLVLGVRGPITYDVLKSAGYKLDKVEFQLDPGLLISLFCSEVTPILGKVGFIPHYRERTIVKKFDLDGLTLIDIDNRPTKIAKQIQECELIYSSSLHGIIFSHSLGRPCIFVRPMTEEPLLKFQDYYASINLACPTPLSNIEQRRLCTKPVSPPNLKVRLKDFVFPTKEVLFNREIAW
jgi:hypothetical protein